MNKPLQNLAEILAQPLAPLPLAMEALPLMVQELEADKGSLMLVNGSRVVHQVLASRQAFAEVAEHKVRTVLSQGLAGWVLKHRQGALASDTALDERWVAMGTPDSASALVVPLMSRGAVIGLLAFHHAHACFFHEAHLARAAEIAHQCAVHFEMALLVESALQSAITLCREASAPSVVMDWQGQVLAVNGAMEALDIVWPGASMAQSLLAQELQATTVDQCDWDGTRVLQSLPFRAISRQFRGAGVWIELIPTTL